MSDADPTATTTTDPPATTELLGMNAGNLKPGDWVWNDGQPREVHHIEPYTHCGDEWVLIVMAGARRVDLAADTAVRPATEADIATSGEEIQRNEIATALEDLADLYRSRKLPPSPITVVADRSSAEEVRRVAELLGVDAHESDRKTSVVWKYRGGALVKANWLAYRRDGTR